MNDTAHSSSYILLRHANLMTSDAPHISNYSAINFVDKEQEFVTIFNPTVSYTIKEIIFYEITHK